MLYLLFLLLAIGYNWRKFGKERHAFFSSLIDAKNSAHREMILSHHFYVFIFEVFLSLVVAHIISERAFAIGILGLGCVYLALLGLGYVIYQSFLKFVEKQTQLTLRQSFNQHLIRELRVNFAVIMLPILIYSIINWAFLDEVYEDWGSLWFIGLLFNIIFVSVLTIVCTVIIMLRLIPNREITEPEYLQLINQRLAQINLPQMRVRWIEADFKNAFVVGLKLLNFSNQTMFLGRSLRTTLTIEEFDAVIAHELAHVANRHVQKRIIDLLKNLLSILIGTGSIMISVIGFSVMYWGEDAGLYSRATAYILTSGIIGWILFNYALLFDSIRSHEYEADAYAVLEMKVPGHHLINALKKLSEPSEMPEYLKVRTRKSTRKSWLQKVFSSHPSLEERTESLRYKINAGLPSNYYFSAAKKIRSQLGTILNWKVSLPLTAALVVFSLFQVDNYRTGKKLISLIQNSSPQEIMSHPEIAEKINAKPKLIGKTLMSWIVKKKDDELIRFFLSRGAEKGRTLVYIAELKDFEMFRKYYSLHQDSFTEDEYFLILRKTASLNFTQAYRHLVNAPKFEELEPELKADIARIQQHTKKDRKPASLRK